MHCRLCSNLRDAIHRIPLIHFSSRPSRHRRLAGRSYAPACCVWQAWAAGCCGLVWPPSDAWSWARPPNGGRSCTRGSAAKRGSPRAMDGRPSRPEDDGANRICSRPRVEDGGPRICSRPRAEDGRPRICSRPRAEDGGPVERPLLFLPRSPLTFLFSPLWRSPGAGGRVQQQQISGTHAIENGQTGQVQFRWLSA